MINIHTKADAFMDDLRRAYRAEFEASAELRAEFLCAADYAAFAIAQNPALVGKMCDSVEAIENEAARRRAEEAGRLSSGPPNSGFAPSAA